MPDIINLLFIDKLNLFSTRKNKNSSNRINIEVTVINKSRWIFPFIINKAIENILNPKSGKFELVKINLLYRPTNISRKRTKIFEATILKWNYKVFLLIIFGSVFFSKISFK